MHDKVLTRDFFFCPLVTSCSSERRRAVRGFATSVVPTGMSMSPGVEEAAWQTTGTYATDLFNLRDSSRRAKCSLCLIVCSGRMLQ